MIIANFYQDFSGFISSLGDVKVGPLLIAMVLFVGYLSLRALAFRNILADSYPDVHVPYGRIWGAYLAAYGFNNVIPARGGDVLKVYLTKISIPGSSYATVGAALLVEAIFDLCAGGVAIMFAIALGVFPDVPSWVSFNAVDLSFVVADGRRALFIVTAIVVGLLVIFSLVALRVRTFWASVRQGFAVLDNRPRYLRRVWGVQGIGWLVRGAAFFFLLRAFGLPATVENVMLVFSANAVAAIFPFTPGGAGVVQALLLELLAGVATGSAIAAYGVGQQATIAVLSLAVGFIALATIFKVTSFRDVIAQGKADRASTREAERATARDAAAGDVSGVADTAGSSPLAPANGGSVASAGPAASGGAPAATGPAARDPRAASESATTTDATAVTSVGEPHLTDDWLAEPDPTWVRPVDPPPATAGPKSEDWLTEELAPDRARNARREERARWRRRKNRDS